MCKYCLRESCDGQECDPKAKAGTNQIQEKSVSRESLKQQAMNELLYREMEAERIRLGRDLTMEEINALCDDDEDEGIEDDEETL